MSKLIDSIGANLKAHAAGFGAAFVLLQADLESVHSFGAIDAKQWVAIAAAYLGIGAIVHVAPNTPKVVVTDVEPGVLDDASHGLDGDAEPYSDGE